MLQNFMTKNLPDMLQYTTLVGYYSLKLVASLHICQKILQFKLTYCSHRKNP